MSEAPNAGNHAVSLRSVNVAYQDHMVLRDVSLDIRTGAVTGVVGPNGAGKSTLIRTVLGLVPPVSGSIRVLGKPFADVRDRVGYVPQAASVDWDFPATVHDVVTMGLYGSRHGRRVRGSVQAELVHNALHAAELTDLARRQVSELSGGQKQRVFVARALVRDPDVLFLDEPFQGIDAKSSSALTRVIRSLADAGRTVVIIHHDLPSVRTMCHDVVLLRREVVAAGPAATTLTRAQVARTYDVSESDEFLEFAS